VRFTPQDEQIQHDIIATRALGLPGS